MDNAEHEENFREAKIVVYRLLNFRLRSEHEIREKLISQKLPNPVIERAIKYFQDLDLLDDRQFARQWIFSRLKKPFGSNRIRQELKQKGIADPIIQGSMDEALQGYDELKTATALAQRRAEKYKDIEPDKVRQRLYGYLQRRGFSTGAIIKAIKTL